MSSSKKEISRTHVISDKGLARHLGESIILTKPFSPHGRGTLKRINDAYYFCNEDEKVPVEKGDRVGITVNRPKLGDSYTAFYDRI